MEKPRREEANRQQKGVWLGLFFLLLVWLMFVRTERGKINLPFLLGRGPR
jgi:hypothetical protein